MPPVAAPSDRFVGRLADLARLSESFARGDRLVTLLGPAGIGKTRMALQFAHEATVRPVSGDTAVWFCELANTRDLAGIVSAVAHALEVPLAAATAIHGSVEQLAHALHARGPALLVLDNVEQVIADAGTAIARWLAAAPGLRVLVTSRELLRITGETAYELAPLSLPGEREPIAASEAVQLFVERARAFDTGFELTEANAAQIAELVRKLDGLPLVIELAAGRIGILGLGGLLSRLPGSLDVLARGKRNAEARQATLRGAIEWSWNLLSAGEQSAFAQCSIFRGGFTLEAAEAVMLRGDARDPAIIDVVHALCDRSLVRNALTTSDGTARLSLYEVAREFAFEKLRDSGDLEATVERHAAYYLRCGGEWARDVERRGGGESLRQLANERDNLLAVIDRALSAPTTTDTASSGGEIVALEAALCLDVLLAAQGPSGFHAEMLDRVVARVDLRRVHPVLFARALRARGALYRLRGRLDEARSNFDSALEYTRRARDRQVEASVLADLGVMHHQMREMTQARSCYDAALALFREGADRRSEGRTLGNIGAIHHDVGEYDAALEHYRRALAIFRAVGDARLEGIFLTNLGVLEQERRATREAQLHYEQALEILETAGDRRLTAITSGNLAVLLHEHGALDAARARHEVALRTLREVGDVRSEGLCLGRLGAVHAALGRIDDAQQCFRLAERRLEPLGDRVALLAMRVGLGFVDLAQCAGATDSETERVAMQSIAERIAAVRAAGPDGGPSVMELSDDVRLTVRILEAAVARVVAASARTPSIDALVVQRDARMFRVPHGEWQELQQFGPVRKILLALVEHHQRHEKHGLTLDALQEAGWPGQRLLPEAAANRVYVALASLRKRGLKAYLVRHDDGYLLDPALRVEWIERPSTPVAL